jgi:tetratricopeptide (TPR) repeat protein
VKPSIQAENRNEEGRRLRDEGNIAAAESAYREAMELDPEWPIPVYNLGLLYKYAGRWEESLELNRQAAEMSPDDQAAWWNLGIAATALSRWEEARQAWAMCGLNPPPGDGAPDFNFGLTPVRLDPDGDAEVVWAHRIDPARSRIANVPLPTSRFRWGDVVLTDGAVEGEREYDGRAYPVFNVLERLVPSEFETFVIELATADDAAIVELEQIADEHGVAAENWGTHTRILCRDCSYGRPHEHAGETDPPAHPHCGLAARTSTEAEAIISEWMKSTSNADVITWYSGAQEQ